MNCDQAFDLMTDPVLDDCAALHRHLDECPRCRQMYETLSPALGLFERVDAPPPAVSDDAEAPSSVEIAERVAVSLRTSPAPPVSRRSGRVLAAYVAASVIGFATAFGLMSLVSEPSASSPLLSEECLWLNRDAADDNQRSDAVVLSCVTCHLGNSVETSDTGRLDLRLTVLAGLIN